MKSSEIRIRDPFILSDAKSGTYYLYGTTDKLPWGGPGEGFDVYAGRDLVNWEGPYPAFRKSKAVSYTHLDVYKRQECE